MITGSQIRAARALLGVSANMLAETAKVGIATIRRAESTNGQTNLTVANAQAIKTALENAGVLFIDENGEGPGVRLRKS